MTFPAPAGTPTSGTLFASNQDITLPTGIQAGELISIKWGASLSNADNTWTPPSGWTFRRLHRQSGLNAPCCCLLYKRVADSTEAAALSGATVRLTLGSIAQSTYIVDRISGAMGVLAFDCTNGTSTSNNPPGLVAPWGLFDYLWEAVTVTQNPVGISSYPASFTGSLASTGPAGAGNSMTARAFRQVNVQSLDPATFTTNASPGSSVTVTLVYLPADAATPCLAYSGRSTHVSAGGAGAPPQQDTMVGPWALGAAPGKYVKDGDTVLLVHESANQFLASNFYAAQGFVEVGRYGTGTAGAAAAVGVQAFLCLSVLADDLKPVSEGGTFVYGDTGDHTVSAYFVLESVPGFEATLLDEAGSTQTLGASAAGNLDTFSVSQAATIITLAATDRDASSTSNYSAWAPGNLADLVERYDQSSTTGAGGGLGAAFGFITSAGALGTLQVTNGQASSNLIAAMTIALGLTAISGGGGGDGRPKVWDGDSWERKPLKWWSGSAFVEKPLMRWAGSDWEPA